MVGAFRLPSGSTTTTPTGPTATPWVRPTDWLAMPTIGSQEVVGLLAITNDDANYVAVQAQGAYTVDWGDGTITNYASNAIASRQYTFSSISAATTTSKGYRQVLVRITPQAGNSITVFTFQANHPSLAKSVRANWLDIDINLPNVNTLAVSSNSLTVRLLICERVIIRSLGTPSLGTMFFQMVALKSVYIEPSETSAITQMAQVFDGCTSLEEAPLFDTSAAVSTNGFFNACKSLVSVPAYNFGNTLDCSNLFNGCSRLYTIPLISTGKCTTFNSAFNACTSLVTIPLLDTGKATNMGGMFAGCGALETIPLLNTSLVTNMNTMFSNCTALETIPLIDTSKVTIFTSMFNNCQSLKEIPLLNTGLGQTFTTMFQTCASLKSIPLLNTSQGTTVQGMFNGCASLREMPLLVTASASSFSSFLSTCGALESVPAFNTSAGTNFTSMFASCFALKAIPALNTAAGTVFTTMFVNIKSIAKSDMFGARFAHTYTDNSLSQAAIVNIFNNLGTASGAQAITVSSNPGYAGLTVGEKAIATGKGWTIA